jgi:NTP pyrophosphatase (non-canonical NTP hydrolase)
MIFTDIADLVKQTNPERHASTLGRRCIKLLEELGEVSEAWLNVTSPTNGKGKSWDDVREEMADCLIVALDIVMTPIDNIEDFSVSETFDSFPLEQLGKDEIEELLLSIGQNASDFYASARDGYHDASSIARDFVENAYFLCFLDSADQPNYTIKQKEDQLLVEIKRKIEKWETKRALMTTVTNSV